MAKNPSAPPPSTSSHTGFLQPLEALNIILRSRGARYEGDVFSVLWQSPYILRSWEFALVDGAIDCNEEFKLGTSFVDRLAQVKSRFLPESRKLVRFDIKSKISQEAGDQIYNTSTHQQSAVAFYIGLCAADTSFVELIPNFHQHKEGTPALGYDPEEVLENRQGAVNDSRVSKLHASAYKLDPCNSPYRMPFTDICEAIHRVRRTAQGKGIYINPHTLVEFSDWKPSTTSFIESLISAEHIQHFTAYKAAMEIYRIIKIQPELVMGLDFVGLQPRLVDFKLITSQTPLLSKSLAQHRLEGLNLRQSFIQHKLDGKDRSRFSRLSKVAIARGAGKDRRWYFSALDNAFVSLATITHIIINLY